jgi:hypothetical protein
MNILFILQIAGIILCLGVSVYAFHKNGLLLREKTRKSKFCENYSNCRHANVTLPAECYKRISFEFPESIDRIGQPIWQGWQYMRLIFPVLLVLNLVGLGVTNRKQMARSVIDDCEAVIRIQNIKLDDHFTDVPFGYKDPFEKFPPIVRQVADKLGFNAELELYIEMAVYIDGKESVAQVGSSSYITASVPAGDNVNGNLVIIVSDKGHENDDFAVGLVVYEIDKLPGLVNSGVDMIFSVATGVIGLPFAGNVLLGNLTDLVWNKLVVKTLFGEPDLGDLETIDLGHPADWKTKRSLSHTGVPGLQANNAIASVKYELDRYCLVKVPQ